jgi:ribosomal protein S27AE
MPIRLICLCGHGMSLPVKYAGRHIECPKCHAVLSIPTAQEDFSLTRWYCKCGLRLKARARTGGHKLRCPRCSAEVIVPLGRKDPAFVEENFLFDEGSGIMQQVTGKPLTLDPEALGADRPPAKKDSSVYELEPATGAERTAALRPPAPLQKPGAKEGKAPPPREPAEEESWAVEDEK